MNRAEFAAFIFLALLAGIAVALPVYVFLAGGGS